MLGKLYWCICFFFLFQINTQSIFSYSLRTQLFLGTSQVVLKRPNATLVDFCHVLFLSAPESFFRDFIIEGRFSAAILHIQSQPEPQDIIQFSDNNKTIYCK